MPCAYAESAGIVDYANGGECVVIVRQRFTHAHEDDIGDPRIRVIARFLQNFALCIDDLGDDFTDRQLAAESLLPSGTESASKGATGLGRHADCATRPTVAVGSVTHQNGLDQLAVVESE